MKYLLVVALTLVCGSLSYASNEVYHVQLTDQTSICDTSGCGRGHDNHDNFDIELLNSGQGEATRLIGEITVRVLLSKIIDNGQSYYSIFVSYSTPSMLGPLKIEKRALPDLYENIRLTAPTMLEDKKFVTPDLYVSVSK